MSVLNVVGLPGSGKSILFAEMILQTLDRNEKWYNKTGSTRLVYSNIRLSDFYEKRYNHFLRYWTDANTLYTLRDCDIFIDEIAGYFNSRDWETMAEETRQWLMMHEHYGCELFCNTQSWKTIEVSFRRLTTQLVHISKWLGCRRPSPTKPPVKFIWGLINSKNIAYRSFDDEEWEFQSEDVIGSFHLITKDKVAVYNTRQDLDFKKKYFAKHIEKECRHCDWKDIIRHR